MLSTNNHPAFSTPIEPEIDGTPVNLNLLLRDLLESSHPLPVIADTHKLKVAQLIAWMAQPSVRSLLDAADELAHRRASHAAAQSRHQAISILSGQCYLGETPRDRDLASRAARALLRVSEPDAPPARNPRRKRPRPLSSSESVPVGIPHPESGGIGVPPVPIPAHAPSPPARLASIAGAAPNRVLRIPVFRFPSLCSPLPISSPRPQRPSGESSTPSIRNGHDPSPPRAPP